MTLRIDKMFSRTALKALAGALATLALVSAPVLAQAKDWKQDWEETVAAAKKEGELIVSGPSGRVWRDALMKFQEEYPEIELKITPAASREFWPRVVKEREVGQYLWDLRVGGPDALSYDLKAKGVMAPVREILVLPEVVDDSKWIGGLDGAFLDKDNRYFLGFAMYEQTTGHYNKNVIKEPFSAKDLIDPKWKGKITMADPRGGSSNTSLAVLYKRFGKDFVAKLLAQDPVVPSQWRQQMDWMIAGRQPIAIGIPSSAFVEYAKRGVNLDHIEKFGANAWSQGVGGLQLLDKAPHPNAAKVFINWLVTQDVQNDIMKAVNLNSRRKDVPIYNKEEAVSAEQIDDYIAGQAEVQMPYRDKVKELLEEVGFNK